MTVTIVKKVFLHDVDIELPKNLTQKDINEAVKIYLEEDDYDWDNIDYLGNQHMDVYDNNTGIKIFSTDD